MIKNNKNIILVVSASIFLLQNIIACDSSQIIENTNFYLLYQYSGLGSNIGKFNPVIRIKKKILNYTYEQNSYYRKKDPHIDSVFSCTLKKSSIDSILALIEPLKDTFIFKSNPCIRSGGIHFLTISDGTDTTSFELGNTLTTETLLIMNLLNQYLPEKIKIFVTEAIIDAEEDCWKQMLEMPIPTKKHKKQ